ncbi:MAG TPA: hypothetical protein VJ882_04630 [Desulfuromonadales bacterium]|nr:hypothetical protein [Desulfuromonadales bacterium]
MESATYSPDDPIEARCTKCRKNNSHKILTVEEGAPVRVECSICNRQHKYRPPSVPRKAAGRRPADPNAAARKEWATLRPDMNASRANDYCMTDKYKVNALINHPVFGLGLVQRLSGPRKVEVLFEDGMKTMRCK